MLSCRRRDASDQEGWTCSGNTMVEEALQDEGQFGEDAEPIAEVPVHASVKRRRRNENMLSCRRRDTSDQEGWTCFGNTMIEEAVQDEDPRAEVPAHSQVQRRRRNENMLSCRRRDASDQKGWTCSGNTMIQEAVRDEE